MESLAKKPALEAEMDVDVLKFFQKLWHTEVFQEVYHTTRTDTELKIGAWEKKSDSFFERTVTYRVKVKAMIGPSSTACTEIQRYHLTKDCLIVDLKLDMLDIPYADYFTVESKWVINNTGPSCSKLQIFLGVNFHKKNDDERQNRIRVFEREHCQLFPMDRARQTTRRQTIERHWRRRCLHG